MEIGGREGGREGRKDGGGGTENKRVKRMEEEGGGGTQNRTAVKTVKDSNMEVVRQVLSKSVSGNWEKGDHHRGPALWVTQQYWAGCQGPAKDLLRLG